MVGRGSLSHSPALNASVSLSCICKGGICFLFPHLAPGPRLPNGNMTACINVFRGQGVECGGRGQRGKDKKDGRAGGLVVGTLPSPAWGLAFVFLCGKACQARPGGRSREGGRQAGGRYVAILSSILQPLTPPESPETNMTPWQLAANLFLRCCNSHKQTGRMGMARWGKV